MRAVEADNGERQRASEGVAPDRPVKWRRRELNPGAEVLQRERLRV